MKREPFAFKAPELYHPFFDINPRRADNFERPDTNKRVFCFAPVGGHYGKTCIFLQALPCLPNLQEIFCKKIKVLL